MAEHNVAASAYYAGGWHLVGDQVHEATGIKVSRGYAQERQLRPQKITWQFMSDHNEWDPDHPNSLVYGVGGQNMPIAIAADLVLLATVEASELQPGQTVDFAEGPPLQGRRYVDLVGEGLLRRIGQWTDPLRSAMYRQITRFTRNGTNPTLRGHWSLEDARGSTSLANGDPHPAALAGTYSGDVELSADDGPKGAGAVLRMNPGGTASGTFRGASGSVGWQFAFAMQGMIPTTGATEYPVITWRTNNGYTWEWAVDQTSYNIKVTNSAGTVLLDQGVTFGAGAEPDKWIMFRFKVSVAAGTVTVEAGWYTQLLGTLYGLTWTFPGTAGALQSWRIDGNAGNDGNLYCHVFGLYGTTDDLQDAQSTRSFDGYIGERAGSRFDRLLDEEDIDHTFQGSTADTMRMGAQKPDTLYNLLRECADTDDAMIFERRNTNGLIFRTRRDRMGQTPALVLTYPDHIADPFTHTYDDQGVMNRVTVSQRDGADVTKELASGPMSTAGNPPGIGPYKGGVDVNVENELLWLPQLADWWLARGTVPMPRFPSVTIDLDANPGLAASVHALDPGDVIAIDGYRADRILLMIIGLENVIQRFRGLVTLTCIPAAVFDTARYDDGRRMDSGSTTLAGVESTSSTAWEITTVNRSETWATAGGYDWLVGGERVHVTVVTAPAGTGPYTQTATVVRSVNGIVKAHAAGESVRLPADQAVRSGL